ncbi:MAG: ATP-binding protein [Sphaerochaetaceae bacterium]|nr:ATP-binding protein [Sphaerochaetaceae bacterium]
MKRFAYEELVKWKNSKSRKPLVLNGARQVGKTWLLKEFGKNEFINYVYINCENNTQLEDVFSDYDTSRIIRNLSAITSTNINKQETLIILDEIQEFPKALTSLKYFQENDSEYCIAVAGSLLGLLDHKGTGFPVGKVDTVTIYPLSFEEFLLALGKDILVKQIKDRNWQELSIYNTQLTELLRQYYFTGGMPEVVLCYVQSQDLQKVRLIQKQILEDYKNDISKHSPKTDIAKIHLVWESIPSQIAKENKKFVYGAIKKGGRAREFENSIQWLVNAGLVYKIHRSKKLLIPLKFYEDFDCFKLYLNDLGLLGAMVNAPASEILVGNNSFSSYKGSFTEQYVIQQYMSSCSEEIFYYSNDNSTLELDFVIQKNRIYPIEVKAEENLKSKSLSTVLKNNENLFGIRFSMSDYKVQEQMVNVPLVLCEEYVKALN